DGGTAGPSGTSRTSRDAASRSATSSGGRSAKLSTGSPGALTRTLTVGGPATLLARNRIDTRVLFAQVPGLVATTWYRVWAKPPRAGAPGSQAPSRSSPTVHVVAAAWLGPATRISHTVRPAFSKKPRSAYGVADRPSGGPQKYRTSFQLSRRSGT